ncbi:uncharacterized protein M421DRAFT_7543 [Didymella exigua CBS 183.55]|uniref:Transcription factor TFIIIC triple barrel domain-containing protein n=1 Tax=Didymella exigua CBS 183.55 TaxID=1150837 RepID=A0A6A5REQ8_9PLEO|nr:uncharacterized protein M421DRAFT_7543 [Didymella exigua CBS 183.55]KAF1925770.1 hypothetical protein M421DRAFT_7543 [Didymella exigua CBS 183.55]
MGASADEDWEYEYDEVETDDFYIPIDLSNVPKGQKHVDSDRRTGHPTLLKSRLRALNAQRGQQKDAPTIENARINANGEEATTLGEAQIIGLHTENPLVMYNGQLLSLQWASTIGTDMYFAKPDADTDSGEKPLRSLPNVDLLAMSSAKLVAKVGRLRPGDDLFKSPVEAEAAQPEVIAQDLAATLTPPPTSFLARLNAAKAKRGDSMRLAISKSEDGSRLVSEVAGADAVPSAASGSGDVEMGGT